MLIAPNGDKAWPANSRADDLSAVPAGDDLLTMLGVWQIAVVFGYRVPSMADTFVRPVSEKRADNSGPTSP